MRALILVLLISLTSCSMLQPSDADVRTAWATLVAKGEVEAACAMTASPEWCTFWRSSRLRYAYQNGELGRFTVEDDLVRFEGDTCFYVYTHDGKVTEFKELITCPAQPVPAPPKVDL